MADPTTSSRAPWGLGVLPTHRPVPTYNWGLNITLLTLFAFPTDQGHNILKTSRLSQMGRQYVHYDPAQRNTYGYIFMCTNTDCIMLNTEDTLKEALEVWFSHWMLCCFLLRRSVWQQHHRRMVRSKAKENIIHTHNYTLLLSQEGRPWLLSSSTASNWLTRTHK